jgi:hypothetical protein
MDSDDEVQAPEGGESWFVLRPAALLMGLPYAMRWEVTRRHPYYLRFWQQARNYYERPADESGLASPERGAALVLQGIGASGPPPPPAATAESLGAGTLSQDWESGAVAPLTFRGLIGLLTADLPPDLLAQAGRFLTDCATAAGGDPEQKHAFLTQLCELKHPALDACPSRPVVGVNINAAQSVIAEAMERLVKGWKEQKNIPEQRRRDDKLEDYLAVWDLREGWAADHYDCERERSLREIAKTLHISLSTAANRYRSAFRVIVGREYSPALWARVIAGFKLSMLLDPEELPRRTLSRPWRDKQSRPVPESVLQPRHDGEKCVGLLNLAGVDSGEIAYVDLVLDVQTLIDQGRSNEEIVATLEMESSDAATVIEYLRQRHVEVRQSGD